MSLSFTKTFNFLLALSLLFCFTVSNAQDKYEKLSFRIDSFANVGLPKSALKEVDKLDALAHADNNFPQQIKAVTYRMTFQSYLEEDALVAIITRLKADADRADYPVKPVLQSLLAQIYWKYYQQNRYRFSQRTKQEKQDADFRNWDIPSVINEASRLYALSLQDAGKEQATSVEVLDGVLAGDKETRYLRPTLYDLLVQRAFDFYLLDEAGINKPKMAFSLNDARFFADSRTFANLTVKTTDTASTLYNGIKYLQQATLFHLQKNDREALADLDLKRLNILNSQSTLANKDSLYLRALRQITVDFSSSPIVTSALVLIGNYYSAKDSLTIARSYYRKAAALFPKSTGGKNGAVLVKQMEAPALSASVEDLNVPGKPLLGLVNYTNVTGARISIYHLSPEQLQKFVPKSRWTGVVDVDANASVLKRLKQMDPVQSLQLALPGSGDYRKHTAEFKIDALPVGFYVLLIDDTHDDKSKLAQLATFNITRLAFIKRALPGGKTELRVIDRDNGAPLPGVKVTVNHREVKNYKMVTRFAFSGLSDANGRYLFTLKDRQQYNIELSDKGDSFFGEETQFDILQIDDAPKPIATTILFTDRQLYRPGQTVYFKALQISTANGTSSIVPNQDVEITFKDINYKTISTLTLRTNEYGSVQGSFIIPQSVGNGQVALTSPNGSINIRVEEYKRPTFRVTFLPITESYRFNDSVKVIGKVTSFAGYGISNARVAYHIISLGIPAFVENFKSRHIGSGWTKNEVKTDTITSNSKGEFEVNFKALADTAIKGAFTLNYTVNADATDASGETQTANTMVSIATNPLEIAVAIPKNLSATDDTSIPLKLNNTNGHAQKGTVAIKIYALKQAQALFKSRVWQQTPDKFILTRNEFKKAFPAYAWPHEDEPENWEVLEKINEASIKTDSTSGTLDLSILKKRTAGVYKIVVEGRSDKGDTASITRFIDVATGPQRVLKTDNIADGTQTVKPGGQAEYLIGIDKPSRVLMEKYDGPKLLSSEWVTLSGPYQQTVKIPVPVTANNGFAVQFLTVSDNRMYRFYGHIALTDTVKKLDIRFITFRNKLQPGEKEQWKLQVKSGNDEKQAAEMLAALYDASLDDIAPAQYWRTDYGYYSPFAREYFDWDDTDFSGESATMLISDVQPSYGTVTTVIYETLNLMGYQYYGGNNSGYQGYLQQIADSKEAQKADKKLADAYFTNAAQVKKGYDITGRVLFVGEGLKGAKIGIQGTKISTVSNSLGYFKIKVPVNAVLIFSLGHYSPKLVRTSAAKSITVEMVYKTRTGPNGAPVLEELEVADPGQKNLKGFKNYAVVGYNTVSAPAATMFASPVMAKLDGQVMRYKASAPVAMQYDEIYGNVTMREIRTKLGEMFAPPATIRKNFNETAFFYPQLHTDEKGQVLIDFTIPEALTRWKFRGFAHTKDLQTGYIENEVITQKQLSISANMPRFLREGDTIAVSARLANLAGKKLNGTVKMQLFNALNMQPVNLFLSKADAEQSFEVDSSTNKAITFNLVIPAGLDALTYRLTADAGQFTDGEENTLPVLPNHTLVTESMPMMVRAGQSRSFTFDKLVNQKSSTLQNKTLTLEYTQNPAWYAVQALPYMMEFPYECSEQTFSRYYANSLATNLVNKLPAIKQVFEQWKSSNSTELLSNLEKNQELKATLIEETPWLKDAVSETEQKKRIALLFDLNKMSDELRINLEKLQKKQLPDGGFPWFGGDRSDRYITQHILQGIGELRHLNIGDEKLDAILIPALNYTDRLLVADDKAQKKEKGYATRPVDPIEIQAWFARSYFLDRVMDDATAKVQADYLKRATAQWTMRNVYEQAMIALTMQRYKKPAVTQQIEKSLLETAQQSDDMGMYWAKNQRGYFWYESPVETQSLLIELFTEAGDNANAFEEMKIWLLRNKQANNWKTTTATASACYALLLKGGDILTSTGTSEIKLNGKVLEELKPDVKTDAGTGYIKTSWVDEQVKPSMGKIDIKNNSANLSWGAMHWQYLESLDKITSAQTNIQLTRKYFIQKQTDAGAVLVAVDATHQPKTGDLLKVVINLKADRDFEYVQLKDLRPAGTEPVEAISTYKYQDGLYYYQVSKDVATNFFISYLNKGNYVFEYQLRVAQPGNFSTGITTIQSMYAPEFNAHSEGGRMGIKP